MNKFAQWIASLGQNIQFVAFMAHSGFAATVLLIAKGNLWVAGIGILLALAKEFWFDMKYETSPPQTIMDSVEDFAGYLAGIIFGVVVAHLGL